MKRSRFHGHTVTFCPQYTCEMFTDSAPYWHASHRWSCYRQFLDRLWAESNSRPVERAPPCQALRDLSITAELPFFFSSDSVFILYLTYLKCYQDPQTLGSETPLHATNIGHVSALSMSLSTMSTSSIRQHSGGEPTNQVYLKALSSIFERWIFTEDIASNPTPEKLTKTFKAEISFRSYLVPENENFWQCNPIARVW